MKHTKLAALGRLAALVGLGTLASLAARAHHSPAVFDQSKEVEITGVVTEFTWANPHSWIHLDVTTETGTVESWSVEMNPPTYLVRGGWRSNTIQPGDRVTVVIHPLRTNEKAGQYVSITLPDGRVLGEQPAVLGEDAAADGGGQAAETVAPVLWQPSMNVFRRFEVAAEKMFEFYGDVLGLEQLSTINLTTGTGVARFQAGASELKFTRRVAGRSYAPGDVDDATGLRLITLYYADTQGLIERFTRLGYPAPEFRMLASRGGRTALVEDPDGQLVELVVIPNAPESTYARIDVGVTVSDIETSRAFYRGFVGLEELAPWTDDVFGTTVYPFRHAATTINVRSFGAALPADTGSGGIQYVVSDVDHVDRLAKQRSIAIDQPLSTLAGFSLRTIWLDDPDGITNYFAETAASRASRLQSGTN